MRVYQQDPSIITVDTYICTSYTYVLLCTIVFVVSVDECAHAVVPELDDSIVETGQDPGPRGMERQPCNTQ